MKKYFESFLGKSRVSEKELDLLAYSYDSSQMEGVPRMVVWPETAEQVQKIVNFCNRNKAMIVARGEGTNLVGATVLESGIVMHMSGMQKINYLNEEEGWVDVEPGLRLGDLNDFLVMKGLEFPIMPFMWRNHSLGGLVAINYSSRRSHSLGDVKKWVIEADIVDGRAKFFTTQEKDLFVGKEGTTGIITRLRLRLAQRQTGTSLTIKQFKELTSLLLFVDSKSESKSILSIEYLNPHAAALVGIESKHTLFIEYSNIRQGEFKELKDIRNNWAPYKNAYTSFRSQGYNFIEDFTARGSTLFDFLEWCNSINIPVVSSIGLGIVHPFFKSDQRNLMVQCYDKIISLRGSLNGCFGWGRLKKGGVTADMKKRISAVKEKTDYNNMMNPGCLIDYK